MYRTARIDEPKRTAEPGIVDDMVRQFADRFAFARELVQNGIDAGATRILVLIETTPEGRTVTSFDDDGCGMTRKTIEGPLLTLFESSKESDSSKIGKYGVGFVSVFAVAPDRVEVLTWRDGEAHKVTLLGDHSYELAREPVREGHGTVVSLVHGMPLEEVTAYADSLVAALTKWCRHARIPIMVQVLGADGSRRELAIQTPLSLPGPVVVTAEEDGTRYVLSVGPAEIGERPPLLEESETFVGFYNRGLTLYESRIVPPEGSGLRVKVDSPKLAHTLSRDNVRHERAYFAVQARVRDLAKDDLRIALYEKLAELATAGEIERYKRLLPSVRVSALRRIEKSRLLVPLATPIDGESTMTLAKLESRSDGPILSADDATPLVRALATRGHPVVRDTALGGELRMLTDETAPADTIMTLATAQDGDEPLCRETSRVLVAAGVKVGRVCIATFEGALPSIAHKAVETDEGEALFETGDPDADGPSATLFLNAEAAPVRLARKHARENVLDAAHLLVRTMLLGAGPLKPKIVDELLSDAGTRRG